MMKNYLLKFNRCNAALRNRNRLNPSRLLRHQHPCISFSSGTYKKDSPIILGIETSCDDTALALVSTKGKVLAECVSSQWDLNAVYKGINPLMAARSHGNNLPHVFDLLSVEASQKGIHIDTDIDAIAVTSGPGLEMCLYEGVSFAKSLSKRLNKPLIPINHLEGHILVPRLEKQEIDLKENNDVDFPFLVLLASGGHTELLVAEDFGKYKRYGGTLDDAAGEAFDKVSRMLGLENRSLSETNCHGGALVELAAREAKNQKIENFPHLPIPMRGKNRWFCDLSFSGLKTAVLYSTQREAKKSKANNTTASPYENYSESVSDTFAFAMAHSFQNAAVTHIIEKTEAALKKVNREEVPLTSFVVCGGVASNTFLRDKLIELAQMHNLAIHFPPPRLCVDNGVMIAWTAAEKYNHSNFTTFQQFIESMSKERDALKIKARWPIG
eukprot:g5974.t1